MNTATTNASPNTFMLTMPKADVSFFKTMAKKMSEYKATLGEKIEKANRELKDIKYNYKV